MGPDEPLSAEISIGQKTQVGDTNAIRVILRNNSLKSVKFADIDVFSDTNTSARATFRDLPSGSRAEQTIQLLGQISRHSLTLVFHDDTSLDGSSDEPLVSREADETAATIDITIGGPASGAPIPEHDGKMDCVAFGYFQNPNARACTFQIKEIWWQEGPSCNVIGESRTFPLTLQAYERRNMGCAKWTSVNSWCIERKDWKCLSATWA